MRNLWNYRFINQLVKLPFIEEIWIYGSRARGDFKDNSDIDIAIVCPLATDEEWLQVTQVIEEADTLLKIDCLWYDSLKEESKLKKNIFHHKNFLRTFQ